MLHSTFECVASREGNRLCINRPLGRFNFIFVRLLTEISGHTVLVNLST